MSKKIALLVSAEVMTRVVVEVADDFDVENISEEEFSTITESARNKLIINLSNDLYDCIDTIELDKECPIKETYTAQDVSNLLKENGLYGDVYEHENGCFSIEIEWGDWKHDHAFCDHLMREFCGYTCTDEKVTEENGSDTYSSIHFYEKS